MRTSVVVAFGLLAIASKVAADVVVCTSGSMECCETVGEVRRTTSLRGSHIQPFHFQSDDALIADILKLLNITIPVENTGVGINCSSLSLLQELGGTCKSEVTCCQNVLGVGINCSNVQLLRCLMSRFLPAFHRPVKLPSDVAKRTEALHRRAWKVLKHGSIDREYMKAHLRNH